MKPGPSLSALEAVQRIADSRDGEVIAVDVRSEGEFAKGSLPGFVSVPVLNDRERHEVGITYKREGQESAVRLGYDLVSPEREARTNAWIGVLRGIPEGQPPLVTCWRGGLRSQIACSWIEESGVRAVRIQDGYKGVRNLLLRELERPPRLRILSGMTGSGKTELLKALTVPRVDLEGLAHHRGSSFGRNLRGWQPAQATFENRLAVELKRCPRGALLEDESMHIGGIHLPRTVKEAMKRSPVILLRTTDEERLLRLHREYVIEPIAASGSPDRVLRGLLEALERIRMKLGHAMTDELARAMKAAFSIPPERLLGDPEAHRGWIIGLLHSYYDKLYRYSFEQQERPVVFEGGFEECRQWIEANPFA